MAKSSDPFGLVNSTIAGRYAVEQVVGEGGFSVVYRARHTLWKHPVAIKAFRGFEALDSEARDGLLRAFVQEGAILAELSERTTAVVQARDTATLVTPGGDWVPYLVLEWLEGETLEALLWHERRVGLPPRTLGEAVGFLDPLARALALAHSKGICHRDLKPGNVFVLGDARGEDRAVKLLDFGTAGVFFDPRRTLSERWTALQASGFTPLYGAPEQFSASYGVTGPWTDVFALALIFVELLVGRQPMGDGLPHELARAATDPRRRPTPRALGRAIPDSVESVFVRALAVYPAERWQTAGSFWRALHEAMTAAPCEPAPAPSQRPLRVAPAAAFAIALTMAASVISDHRVGRAVASRPRAVASSSTR
ncbi:MAG TPA: serine/threonine-protein kinase [Polyangiaceae bacterium]|nr:serine/threonine-protein kinase [Polyangiaceae bacterium]